MHQLSKHPITPGKNKIKLFLVTKNSRAVLSDFLAHYRRIGVNEFYIVDNDSTDGSDTFLLQQPDVHLFHTTDHYGQNRSGMRWINTLLERYAHNCWCLTVDIDELFIYPFYETMSLPKFCQYLDQSHYQGVYALMLDVYDKNKTIKQLNQKFEHLYYDDVSTYRPRHAKFFPYLHLKGGPRNRIFFDNNFEDSANPCLTKIPLIKHFKDFQFVVSTHSCTPIRLADVTAGLVHFKLTDQFIEYVKQRTYHKERTRIDLFERYRTVLQEQNDTISYFDAAVSKQIQGTTKLISDKLFSIPTNFINFCQQQNIGLDTLPQQPTNYQQMIAAWPALVHAQNKLIDIEGERHKAYWRSKFYNILYQFVPTLIKLLTLFKK